MIDSTLIGKCYRVPSLAILITLFVLSGCDFFSLDTESSIVAGRWSSNIVPSAGDCCGIDLTLDNDDEMISGRGIIKTPGSRVGDELHFSIDVTGTYRNGRLELESTSEANKVFIQGALIQDSEVSENVNFRVNFEGFGFTARDIVLFPRD